MRIHYKSCGLLGCLLLLPAIIGVGCSGSGDGGIAPIPDPGPGPVTVLDVYEYTIADLTGVATPLSVSFSEGAAAFQVQLILGNSLRGTVNTVTDAFTLDSSSSFTVNSDLGDPLLGTFDVNVTVTLDLPADSVPAAGEWQVVFPPVNPSETITVTVVTGFLEGAELSLNGGAQLFFTWEELEDLLGDAAAPDWQQRAALSALVAEFMLGQADEVIEILALIDDPLEINNPLIVMCDAFPGTPPPGVLNQGMFELTWLGSGEIMPGDSFDWNFTDCWFTDPGDNDELINGGVDLLGYNEVVDASNTLTRIGFETVGQILGGVIYDNLTVAETEESSPGIFTIVPSGTITIIGGFSIVFAEPAP